MRSTPLSGAMLLHVFLFGFVCITVNSQLCTFDPPVSFGVDGEFSSMAIGNDSYPIIGYVNGTDLQVVHCTNIYCSSHDNAITLSSIVLESSLAIGSDDFPIVAYRTCVLDVKVIHCTNIYCSSFDSPVTLDTGVRVFLSISVIIESDMLPTIIYYDRSGFLKVVHCTSINCSSFNSSSIGSSAIQSSLANGPDGLIVAYYSRSGNVTLVRCSSSVCDMQTQLVPGSANVQAISLTIGTDGFPIIAHTSPTTNNSWNLQVTHCKTFNCSRFDPPVDMNLADNTKSYYRHLPRTNI